MNKKKSRNQTANISHFKADLNNLPIPPLTTPFCRNTPKKIYIAATDQSTDTNCTRMEYLPLLAITIESEVIAIGADWLGNSFIVEANQASAPIW